MRGLVFNVRVLIFVLLLSSCGNPPALNSRSDYFEKLKEQKIVESGFFPIYFKGKENCVSF